MIKYILSFSICFLLINSKVYCQKTDRGYDFMPRGFADIDGDNKADYITFRGPQPDSPEIVVYQSSGHGFNKTPMIIGENISKGLDNMPRGFAYVNDDHRADYITFSGNPDTPQINVYFSTGNGFMSEPIISKGISKGIDDMPRCFADVNKDGKADYITFNGDTSSPTMYVYLSDGYTFNHNPKIGPNVLKGFAFMPRGFADIDGDGRADYITFIGNPKEPQICVYFANENGFDKIPVTSIGIDRGYDNMPRGFADINGDGKADYITFRGKKDMPSIYVYFSIGKGFKTDPMQSVGFDKGYENMPRGFVYVNDAKKADYVTFRGPIPQTPEIWIYSSTERGFSNIPLIGNHDIVVPKPPPPPSPPPPSNSPNTKTACQGTLVLNGWVVINVHTSPACAFAGSTTGQGIEYTIQKISDLPSGTTLTVCINSKIPPEWETISQGQCVTCANPGFTTGACLNIRKR